MNLAGLIASSIFMRDDPLPFEKAGKMTDLLKNIIRFEQGAEQVVGDIRRIVGFVPSRHMFAFFDNPAIDANPRRPEQNRVTGEILQTLEVSPDLFHFKSKGLLVGTSSFHPLQRNRYELVFDDPTSEGVLDGGHNLFTIGLFFLSKVMEKKDWKRLRRWDDMIEAWNEYRDALTTVRDDYDFLVPFELLVPANNDFETLAAFRIALIDICASRNNNAQLPQEAKANQRGFYDEIKARFEHADDDLTDRVEWKPNQVESDEGRPVKVRDLVALAWLPLNALAEADFLDGKHNVNPVQIYSGKGACSAAFDRLYEDDRVSNRTDVGKYELKNSSVGSALDVLVDLPWLFDSMMIMLPEAYNTNGGKFGRLDAVKMGNFCTPFYGEDIGYKVPDGFLVPLFYGLTALLKVEDGIVSWACNPEEFIENHFNSIVKGFRLAMEMAKFDPQKVAKSENSYMLAKQQFQFALMQSERPAG